MPRASLNGQSDLAVRPFFLLEFQRRLSFLEPEGAAHEHAHPPVVNLLRKRRQLLHRRLREGGVSLYPARFRLPL